MKIVFEVKESGSYYDVGLRMGRLLKTAKIEGFPPKFSKETLDKGMEWEREVQKYTPELLNELRGVAEGSGIDYRVLATFELSPFRLQPSCLVMAISGNHTKDGYPVLARNHEWNEEASEELTICYTKPEGKLRSFGFTFYGMFLSRFGGMNEAGLAISSASTNFVNSGPGVMLNLATRWILDNFESTKEAVEFLKTIPKTWGTAYLLIDRDNRIAKVEAHREKTKVTYTEKGFDFVTLIFDSPEMQKYNEKSEWGKWASEIHATRKEFLSKWFAQNKGTFDNTMIINALKSHERKMCTHDYDEQAKVHYGICWSWILSPGKNKARVCAGPPCKNKFRKFDVYG